MRTPVLLVPGQGGADKMTGTLLRHPGTVVVGCFRKEYPMHPRMPANFAIVTIGHNERR